MGYKILGFVVWNGGRWYVKRRYRGGAGVRRAAVLGLVGVAVVALVVKGTHRDPS